MVLDKICPLVTRAGPGGGGSSQASLQGAPEFHLPDTSPTGVGREIVQVLVRHPAAPCTAVWCQGKTASHPHKRAGIYVEQVLAWGKGNLSQRYQSHWQGLGEDAKRAEKKRPSTRL